MTLKELKDRIDRMYKLNHNHIDDLEVCIPNNKGGMGGTHVTAVRYAGKGIDWDSGKFFIWPEVEMMEIKEKSHE